MFFPFFPPAHKLRLPLSPPAQIKVARPFAEVVFSGEEERRTFRGLLSTPSAMVMWGYLTWASPSASICLHPSHSAWASWCLRLCQRTLIIWSRCDATRRNTPGLFQSHTCVVTLWRNAPYHMLPVFNALLEDVLHIDVQWKSFLEGRYFPALNSILEYCSLPPSLSPFPLHTHLQFPINWS